MDKVICFYTGLFYILNIIKNSPDKNCGARKPANGKILL